MALELQLAGARVSSCVPLGCLLPENSLPCPARLSRRLSPVTGQPLPSATLRPNYAVRSAVEALLTQLQV